MTLGVRIIVLDTERKVLLVRHGYVSGWHLPGGGVEKNETAEDTVHKELLEETGLKVTGRIELLAVYANRNASKRDHVLLYSCPQWQQHIEFKPNREIVEIGFFDFGALPAETTKATRARLNEVFEEQEKSLFW